MAARRTSCETFTAGADYALDVCITSRRAPNKKIYLGSGQAAVDFFHSCINVGALDHERYWVLACDAGLHPIALLDLFHGGVTFSAVDPNLIMRRVLAVPGAVALFGIHNHPSGNPQPSMDDMRLADLIEKAASPLNLRVCDHFVVTNQAGVWSALRNP